MNTITIDKEIIVKSLQVLSGQCDFAQTKDDAGFNAYDAAYGHQCAALGENLSAGQCAAILNMLQKYRRQLSDAGIDIPRIQDDTHIIINDPNKKNTIDIMGTCIYLYFADVPTETTRNLIKSIPGRRWEMNTKTQHGEKPWSVPATQENAKKCLKIMGDSAAQTSSFLSFVNSGQDAQTPKVDDVIIKADKADILVYFPNPASRMGNVAKIKTLPPNGRRWDKDLPGTPWVVQYALVEQIFEMFPEASTDPALKEQVQRKQELAKSNRSVESTFRVSGLSLPLREYQAAGVEFGVKAECKFILADDMGLGKTMQAIGIIAHTELLPALIIAPASVKINWKREMKKWFAKDYRIAILDGREPCNMAELNADIVIINWDILYYWEEAIIAWQPQIIIADEAHAMKNAKNWKSGKAKKANGEKEKGSQRGNAAMRIAQSCPRFIAMTGTPVTNRPIELFPLLNAVDPANWGNFMQYAKRYCAAKQGAFGWDFGGASNLDELNKIIAPYFLRRKKEQVLTELPEKRRGSLVFELSAGERREYNSLVAWFNENKNAQPAIHLQKIEALKQFVAKAKLPAAINWIKEFLESGEKIIVFMHHKFVIEELLKEFKDAVYITGDVSMANRQQAIDKFQNDPDCKVFIGNIKAAGTGITLTAASTVVFLEFAWVPGDMVQAEDRAYRMGQTNSVMVWHAVAENTIEEYIVELLESKRQIADMVHDGATNASAEFSVQQAILEKLVNGG